jgi:hypothetical protein
MRDVRVVRDGDEAQPNVLGERAFTQNKGILWVGTRLLK